MGQRARFAAFGVMLFCIYLALPGCQNPHSQLNTEAPAEADKPMYAQGFTIQQEGQFNRLNILNPWNKTQCMFSCLMVPESTDTTSMHLKGNVLFTPVKSLICLSSTQWKGLSMLGGIDNIKGISEASFVRDETIQSRLKQGLITEVAANNAFKTELIVNIHPDAILYSPDPAGIPSVLLQTGGLLLPWPDYFEQHPLGRAEWIKVCGVLLQKEQAADSLFNQIRNAYLEVKQLAAGAKLKPGIFADKQFSGQWYIPGGKSYMARMFADAHSHYIWEDNGATASFPLDIETIVARAGEADFWRIAHAAPENYSYAELAAEHEIYSQFKAFKQKQVIFCNTTTTAYFEKGPFEPHLQLADLVACMHPELLHGHNFTYYTLLK
ncbi:MAG: ABC transporter substrate-binding protein [Bacteroidetes bacterium]|nr:ABC transporter substrate-binding protein [Bacteroidota bacterium]